MKQIKFNPELIGKPGIEVRVDGEVPDFVKFYPHDQMVKGLTIYGDIIVRDYNSDTLTMYRPQRSAVDIAKEVYAAHDKAADFGSLWMRSILITLVQAGMDEVTDTATGTSTVTNADKPNTLT